MFTRAGQGQDSLSQGLSYLWTNPPCPKAVSWLRLRAGWILRKTKASSTRLRIENHILLCPAFSSHPTPFIPPPVAAKSRAEPLLPCGLPGCQRGCVRLRVAKQHRALQRKQASKDLRQQKQTRSDSKGWEMWSGVLLPRNKYFALPFFFAFSLSFFFFPRHLHCVFYFTSPKWQSLPHSTHPCTRHVHRQTHTRNFQLW